MSYPKVERDIISGISYTEEEAARFSKIREDMFAARHELRWSSKDVPRTPEAPLREDYKSSGDILEASLPSEADREKYWAWEDDIEKSRRTVSRVATTKEYVDAFSHTDYVDPKSIYKLNSLLRTPVYPYIPVGSHTGYRYRLIPCPAILEANKDLCD
jgi:hypothetical protein